jgi:hypothetical protein
MPFLVERSVQRLTPLVSRLGKLDFAHPCGHIPRNVMNPSGGSSMKEFFTQFFTCWNGQTLATRFSTGRTEVLLPTSARLPLLRASQPFGSS